jgi:imidazoleglycerol-phosphate dehydratase
VADGPPSRRPRTGTCDRATRETRIKVSLNLDGTGDAQIATGVGFFDHMLDALARHARFDVRVEAQGDLHIDAHHTVEDTGLAIGHALSDALGDKTGIQRFGSAYAPLDEALSRAVVDISGRPHVTFNATFSREKLGDFDTELIEEFARALAARAGLTLHWDSVRGTNAHHVAESLFKALAVALRQAVSVDPALGGAPASTKGTLSV